MLARATLKGLSALPLHHKGTSLTPTPWPTFYFSYRSSFMGNLLAKPSLSLRNLLERNRQTARASKQQNYIMRFADCLHHPVCCLIVKTRGVRMEAVENNADSGHQPDSSLSLPLIWSGTKFCSTSKYFTKTSAVL